MGRALMLEPDEHLKINRPDRKSLLQTKSTVLSSRFHKSWIWQNIAFSRKGFQTSMSCQQQLSYSSAFIMYWKFLCSQEDEFSNAASFSKLMWVVDECPVFSCCVYVGEVAPPGLSEGRHHLVVYEPTEGRVCTRVNGLLYSLLVRKLGKQWAVVCQSSGSRPDSP